MTAVRLLSITLLGLAVAGAAGVDAQQPATGTGGPSTITDALGRELQRCRSLNEKATADERCKAAYEENRKRSFAPPAADQSGKFDVRPDAADAKASAGNSGDTAKQ
jgi:conjugative transfer region protein TrbK